MGPVRGGQNDGCYIATLTLVIDCGSLDEFPRRAGLMAEIIPVSYFNQVFGHAIECEESMTFRYIQSSDVGSIPVIKY